MSEFQDTYDDTGAGQPDPSGVEDSYEPPAEPDPEPYVEPEPEPEPAPEPEPSVVQAEVSEPEPAAPEAPAEDDSSASQSPVQAAPDEEPQSQTESEPTDERPNVEADLTSDASVSADGDSASADAHSTDEQATDAQAGDEQTDADAPSADGADESAPEAELEPDPSATFIPDPTQTGFTFEGDMSCWCHQGLPEEWTTWTPETEPAPDTYTELGYSTDWGVVQADWASEGEQPLPNTEPEPGEDISSLVGPGHEADVHWAYQGDTNYCGLYSVRSVLHELYGTDPDMNEMVSRAAANGWLVYDAEGNVEGIRPHDLDDILASYGVASHTFGGPDGQAPSDPEAWQALNDALANDQRVVLGVDGREFDAGADVYSGAVDMDHFVAVEGIDYARGVVIVNDSARSAGLEVPINTFFESWRDSNFSMTITDTSMPGDDQAQPPVGAGELVADAPGFATLGMTLHPQVDVSALNVASTNGTLAEVCCEDLSNVAVSSDWLVDSSALAESTGTVEQGSGTELGQEGGLVVTPASMQEPSMYSMAEAVLGVPPGEGASLVVTPEPVTTPSYEGTSLVISPEPVSTPSYEGTSLAITPESLPPTHEGTGLVITPDSAQPPVYEGTGLVVNDTAALNPLNQAILLAYEQGDGFALDPLTRLSEGYDRMFTSITLPPGWELVRY